MWYNRVVYDECNNEIFREKYFVTMCFILSVIVLILSCIYVTPYALAFVSLYAIVWPVVLLHAWEGK